MQKIILYGSATCPMVPSVRGMLQRANADFEYVNISLDSAARQRVIEINQGYASVPTLVFPDGSTLTEPAGPQLQARLEELGYEVADITAAQRVQIILESPLVRIFAIVFLAAGLIERNPWLIVASAAVLLLGLALQWLAKRR